MRSSVPRHRDRVLPTATLLASHTVAEALAFMVKSTAVSEISYIFVTEEQRLATALVL